MKAVQKFLYIVAAVAFFATGCIEQIEHTPAPKVDGQQVYFDVNQNTVFDYSEETPSIEIPLYRLVTEDAFTVNYRFNGDGFNEPAAPSFEAGKNETKFVVTYDPAGFEPGETKTFSIVLTSDTTPYGDGASELTFSVTRPEPWTEIGIGTYRDDVLVSTLFEGPSGFTWPAVFLQNDNNRNLYRVVEPYSRDVFMSIFGTVPDGITLANGGYIEFELSENEEYPGVTFAEIIQSPVGMSIEGLGDMYLASYQVTGTFADGVATFPAGAAVLVNVDWRGYLSNPNGLLAFAMPGVSLIDAFISAAYAGMNVNADGSVVEAIFDFELGPDVESYVFTLVEGNVQDDPSEVVAGLIDGTIEGQESSADQTRWAVELSTGYYTLVAVPYASGKAQEADVFANYFYFAGVGAGEKPEAEINVQVGAPSSFFAAEEDKAAVEAETPACFYIGLNITANAAELKTMRAWWGTVASYEAGIASGLTDEAIIADYAADLSGFFEKLAENGSVTARMNVNNGYEYKVLFAAETVYGTTITWSGNYTPAEYNGALAVGEYAFADAETQSQMVFALVPGKSYSDYYFVHNYIDGSMWYVTYDATAGTITGEGVELNFEKYGSQWGGLYGAFNEDATQVYGYFSSTTADFAEPAPMVMTVADNAIAGLETYFAMMVVEYDPVNDVAGSILGAYFNFTPATVIAPAGGALQARVQSVNAKFNAKAAQMEACEVHSVIASTYGVVANVELARSSKSFNARPYDGKVEYKLSSNFTQQLR